MSPQDTILLFGLILLFAAPAALFYGLIYDREGHFGAVNQMILTALIQSPMTRREIMGNLWVIGYRADGSLDHHLRYLERRGLITREERGGRPDVWHFNHGFMSEREGAPDGMA